jgi:predicted transcriptional regulator
MTKPIQINGHDVSTAQLDAWVAEAEAGYDVGVLKKRGRPRMGSGVAAVATLRLDPELAASLDERVRREGSSRSQVVRDALRAWLHAS